MQVLDDLMVICTQFEDSTQLDVIFHARKKKAGKSLSEDDFLNDTEEDIHPLTLWYDYLQL